MGEHVPTIPQCRSRARALALLVLTAIAGAPLSALADTAWPTKSVRVVLPYPAGGPNDMVAQKLSDSLKQPFVIDNRPGATGLTDTDHVAKSPADGYTWLVSASVHVIYPALFQKVPFDPLKDFAPVSRLARAPLVLSVHPTSGVASVKDLIAAARAAPRPLHYASSGNGSATHLAAEAFRTQANIDLQHIAYRGSAPAMADAMAGHVQLIFDSIGSTMPQAKAGKLRALAVTSAARSSPVPDLPTIAESAMGYGFQGQGQCAELRQIPASQEVQQQLLSRGVDPVGSGVNDFRAFNASEMTQWAKVVRDSGAKLA